MTTPSADGSSEPMSIFHAFYVMSYTATTIGFGEIPNPFTDAQRLWVTFSIYLSVLGWAYALGSVIGGVEAVATLTRPVPAVVPSVNANLKPVRDFCESI